MTTIPVPITLPPITIPWPTRTPGVGSPVPAPGVGIPFPTPMPTPVAPAGTNGFAALLKFSLDWRFLGALLFMLLTVGIVDSVWPEYVWPYVGILLLGLTLANVNFGPQLDKLVGG